MGFLQRPSQYFFTLRHLRLRQLVWQVRNRLMAPRADLRPAPGLRSVAKERWRTVAPRKPSMVGTAEFSILNRRRQLATSGDWNNPDWSRLWLYNLHYFDDLNAEGSGARVAWHRELFARWIAENPPGRRPGWEPYPASVRIVNWIKWAMAGNSLDAAWQESLAVQVRWVSKRLEYHLMGNHLFTNAKALVFAGLFFEGEEAAGWLNSGLSILARELQEQVLPDGGHFERSPMYHALALEDVLDLVNLSEICGGHISATLVAGWRETATRMLHWLKGMCHPDGEIALFNDAAFGVSPSLRGLEAYAARLGVHAAPITAAVTHFAESGYVRAELGPAVVFVDVAPIGPDYLPGHGHADTLSFELSVFDQRWLVDSGCSAYSSDAERLRQRGTAAHNTVIVDGQDSSEVWASFRVARRARVLDVRVTDQGRQLLVSGAHDGYGRLRGKVIHRRHWRVHPERLEVEDVLEGTFSSAEAYLHFHPAVSVEQSCASGLTCRRENRVVGFHCNGGDVTVGHSTWHPEFGLAMPNTRVRVKFRDARMLMRFEWK